MSQTAANLRILAEHARVVYTRQTSPSKFDSCDEPEWKQNGRLDAFALFWLARCVNRDMRTPSDPQRDGDALEHGYPFRHRYGLNRGNLFSSGDVKDSAIPEAGQDRKSTRLNSSHRTISYAVFCL